MGVWGGFGLPVLLQRALVSLFIHPHKRDMGGEDVSFGGGAGLVAEHLHRIRHGGRALLGQLDVKPQD